MDLSLTRREGAKENHATNAIMTERASSNRLVVKIAAVILIAAVLLIPFPTQLSPELSIRFVEDTGKPIIGMRVKRSCDHYTYSSLRSECPEDWDNPPLTDSEGYVRFSAVYVWYGAVSRILRTVLSYALLIAHGSVGKSVDVLPLQPKGFAEVYPTEIDLDNPQKEIVMKRDKND